MRWFSLPHLLVIILLQASFLSIGCQTNMKKAFEEVKPGMDKDDVLSIMGSPRSSQRFHGKDRWRYVFYADDLRFEKEVHFLEGTAVYVGEKWEPPQEQSAVVVDQKNEENNARIDALLKEEAAKAKTDFDNYQSQTKGEDKVRYLPTFKGVD
ncbi:MAG: outer membrane protein assembly factor BamE [Bdellovibrionia bacterium]